MHKKGFSLNDAMYHIFNRARKEVGSGNYETNIGYLLLKYHREKNGYRHGREGENWTAPNRKKAAETLKILASLVKFANVDTNSYKIDIDYIRETIPDINKDIKNQIAYEALHDFQSVLFFQSGEAGSHSSVYVLLSYLVHIGLFTNPSPHRNT